MNALRRGCWLGASVLSALLLLCVVAVQPALAGKAPAAAPHSDPASICDATVGNLVQNCGFETGDFSNWVQSGNLGFTFVDNGGNVPVNSGTFAAALGPVDSDGQLCQTLSGVAAETTYRETFYYEANGTGPSDFSAFVNGVELSNAAVGQQVLLSLGDPTNTGGLYQQYSFTFTTPSAGLLGAVSTCFSFRNDPSYDGLDDISVVPILSACTTTITGTHPGNVVAASGTLCVVNAHVTGNVVAMSGASLDIENSTVNGAINANKPVAVRLCNNTVGGVVSVIGSSGFVRIGDPTNGCGANTIGGNLYLNGNTGGLTVVGNTYGGTLTATNNTNPTIQGNMHS